MSVGLAAVRAQRAGSIQAVAHAQSQSYPAPVGGWNARDSIADMKPTDAILMENFFPGQGRVAMRKGSSSYATGLGAQVYTLVEFFAGADRKFIAGANGQIWDITAGGAATSLAGSVTAFTSDKWQTAQFDDETDGARIGLVNGIDKPQTYDTTNGVADMTISGIGLTVTDIIDIHVYASRSYFFNNSRSFWYSAVGALGGTLSEFAVGAAVNFGGNIIRGATWTLDGGDGALTSFLCLFTSTGDVIIYSGTDPSSASAFALVGVFKLGAPLGNRFTTALGKEVVVITNEGFLPLTRVKGMSQLYGKNTISDKIKPAVITAALAAGTNYGWECVLYPEHSLGAMLLFNVPTGASSEWNQFVMNTDTGSWAKFTGWNFATFGIYKNKLYGGGDGEVFLCDDGASDDDSPISAACQGAWNYLKSPGREKKMDLIRTQLISKLPNFTVTTGIGVDFGDIVRQSSIVIGALVATVWDTVLWDTSKWSSENIAQSQWVDVAAVGRAISVMLQCSSANSGMEWLATDYLFEVGGLL